MEASTEARAMIEALKSYIQIIRSRYYTTPPTDPQRRPAQEAISALSTAIVHLDTIATREQARETQHAKDALRTLTSTQRDPERPDIFYARIYDDPSAKP